MYTCLCLNIQVVYRNSSRIVNCQYVDKISLNCGADTNLSFIIVYEIPRLNLNEFNRKYPGRLQKQTLLNSITVNNNYLREPCAYQRACEVKLPEPRLIARSQLRHLQNVKTTNLEINSSVSSIRKKNIVSQACSS